MGGITLVNNTVNLSPKIHIKYTSIVSQVYLSSNYLVINRFRLFSVSRNLQVDERPIPAPVPGNPISSSTKEPASLPPAGALYTDPAFHT